MSRVQINCGGIEGGIGFALLCTPEVLVRPRIFSQVIYPRILASLMRGEGAGAEGN